MSLVPLIVLLLVCCTLSCMQIKSLFASNVNAHSASNYRTLSPLRPDTTEVNFFVRCFSAFLEYFRVNWIEFLLFIKLSKTFIFTILTNFTPTFWTDGCGLSGGQKSGKICQHGKSRLSLFTHSKRFNNFSHVQNAQFEFGKSFMLNICLLWGHLLTYSHYCIQKSNNEHSYPEFVINVFKIPVNSCSFSVVYNKQTWLWFLVLPDFIACLPPEKQRWQVLWIRSIVLDAWDQCR